MAPLVRDAPALLEDLLGPLGRPRHPVALARFAARAALPATPFARIAFRGERARGFFAGLAAHSMLPLSRSPTAGYGLDARRCSVTPSAGRSPGAAPQPLTDALVSILASLGGKVETGPATSVTSTSSTAPVRAARRRRRASSSRSRGRAAPGAYRRRLEGFRYGPGRVQARLGARRADPVAAPRVRARRDRAPRRDARRRSPPRSEQQWRREPAARRSCCSRSRACSTRRVRRTGRHTAWAYCHVPNGSTVDMTERIEPQVERFAPGLPRSDPRPSRRSARPHGAVQPELRRRRHQRRRRRPAAVRSRVRLRGSRPTRRRSRASSSARRRRRPAAACTACAATTRRGRRSATSRGADERPSARVVALGLGALMLLLVAASVPSRPLRARSSPAGAARRRHPASCRSRSSACWSQTASRGTRSAGS